MQARTASEVLAAQEWRLKLQQIKGEMVDWAGFASLNSTAPAVATG